MIYQTTDNGTFTNYYNKFIYNEYTTSTDCNNWNYYPQSTSTTETISSYYRRAFISDIYHNYQIEILSKKAYKPSEEELLRIREAEVKYIEDAKRERAEAEEAERKARLLLTEYLDNENMQRLLNKEPLEVPSKLFEDIKYHIPIGRGRIKALKENKVVTELCLAIEGSKNLPTDDIILTKWLHVLHDEENLLRTANHFNKQENLISRLN